MLYDFDFVSNKTKRLRKKRRKSSWTKSEDERLFNLVETFGRKNWKIVGKYLKGRSGKQCRERWINHLDPGLNMSPWTEEENVVLIAAHMQLGNKWSTIAKLLPGRSDNSIKNHWNSSLRKKKVLKDREMLNLIFNHDIKSCYNLNEDSACIDNNSSNSSCGRVGVLNNKSVLDISREPMRTISFTDEASSGCNPELACTLHYIDTATCLDDPKDHENNNPIPQEIFDNPAVQEEQDPLDLATPEKCLPPSSTPLNTPSDPVDKNVYFFINVTQGFDTPETPTPVKSLFMKISRTAHGTPESGFNENSHQEDNLSFSSSFCKEVLSPPLSISSDSFLKYFGSSPFPSNWDLSAVFTRTPEFSAQNILLSSSDWSVSPFESNAPTRSRSRPRRTAKKRLSFSETLNEKACPFPFIDHVVLSSCGKIILGKTEDQIILTKLAHEYLDSLQ